EIAELEKKWLKKLDMFNQAVKDLYAAYGVDIGKTPNVTGVNVTGATDVITDSNGNKMCKINGTWQPCGGVGWSRCRQCQHKWRSWHNKQHNHEQHDKQ
ncbi:hypothetical protein, partial [Kingella kingae]|uniref:hypothetical protein n=1 Tax=Kingella kingae TaxID=504 RepID=UPI001E41E630